MTRSKGEAWVRLGLGIALNACLWPVVRGLSVWSNYEREFRLTFLAGVLAAVTIVVVIPIFWRGHPWQAPLAFVLLWLPGFALYASVSFIVSYL